MRDDEREVQLIFAGPGQETIGIPRPETPLTFTCLLPLTWGPMGPHGAPRGSKNTSKSSFYEKN